MTLKEKALYNQIHPLKLSTDILAAAISLYLFWIHQPLPALLLHFLPPLLASWLIIRYVDLKPQKDSSFGRYVAASMTRTIEGVRLFGDLVMIFGAWCNGLLPSRKRR